MGIGWAPGPGQIEKFASDKEVGFVANWGSEMNVRPHDGKIAISLYERADIAVGNNDATERFASDELHLWLWQFKEELPLQKPKTKLLPAKLLGNGRVTFATKRISGETNRVQTFWPSAAEQIGEEERIALEKIRAQEAKMALQRAPNRPNAAFQSETDAQKEGELRSKNVDDESIPSQWFLNAGQVVLHLDGQHKMQMVELQDNFRILETSALKEDAIDANGTRLVMMPTAEDGLFKMTMVGNPATIAGRKQSTTANTITLDQHQNTILVDGAGEMRLRDLNRLKSGEQPVFLPARKKRRRLIPLTVIHWNDALEFDGKTITLQGKANVQSELLNDSNETMRLNASAQQIKVKLDRFVDMRSGKKEQIKPEVQQLDMNSAVEIFNETFDDEEELKAIEHMVVDDLMIQPKSGVVESRSAGAIETTRKNIKVEKPQQFAGEALGGKHREELKYIQVNFASGFSGNLLHREMTFHRKVRTVYGPVERWEEKLDLNQPKRHPEVILMDCDQLMIGSWQPTKNQEATVEMKAEGNVSVRSLSFRTNSQRVSFYQASDLLIVGGNEAEPAQIWYQAGPSASNQYAEAAEIKYWHKSGQIAVDQLGKAEYSSEPEQTQPRPRDRSFGGLPIRGR